MKKDFAAFGNKRLFILKRSQSTRILILADNEQLASSKSSLAFPTIRAIHIEEIDKKTDQAFCNDCHKHKDLRSIAASQCFSCRAKEHAKLAVAWAKSHKEVISAIRAKKYRENKPYRDKVKARGIKYNKSLGDKYVCNFLGISAKEAPPDLIELKRLQIKLNREIRKL